MTKQHWGEMRGREGVTGGGDVAAAKEEVNVSITWQDGGCRIARGENFYDQGEGIEWRKEGVEKGKEEETERDEGWACCEGRRVKCEWWG